MMTSEFGIQTSEQGHSVGNSGVEGEWAADTLRYTNLNAAMAQQWRAEIARKLGGAAASSTE